MHRRFGVRSLAFAALLATGLLATITVAAASAADGEGASAASEGYRCAASSGYRCDPRPSAPSYQSVPVGHVGWTYLNLNYCPPETNCTRIYRTAIGAYSWTIGAYSWTNGAWAQTQLTGDQWAYVYPYSSPWRCAWTQRTGWVAVSSGRFELR